MARSLQIFGLATVAVSLGALAVAGARRGQHVSALASHDRACRLIDSSAALLALSALADSGLEHYRGSFHNKAMYVPLIIAASTLAISIRDAVHPRARSRARAINRAAVATGVIGTGFHIYNITKRPGGLCWINLFYAAPLGAPAAVSLAGLLRGVAEAVCAGRGSICGLPPGRLLTALVSIGLIGTSAEAALLHFRGAYHNPAMAIPVTVPPVAAALLARAGRAPRSDHRSARWSLRLLAAIGLLGATFHAYGVGRGMGGWRNWSQNLLNGPPLPAPPAFTALAIAGLAALGLIEEPLA